MRMSAITLTILNAIRRSSVPQSKANLVKQTKFSLATINEHTELLLQRGLVMESDVGPSTGGRKPRLLSFNAKLGYIVAIDVESTRVKVGLTDLNCRMEATEVCRDIDIGSGPTAVLEKTKEIVFQLMQASGIKPDQIKGIGMGLPGPVRFSSGIPASLDIMPGWENYDVRSFWKQYFDCLCFVDNNVNTMALAEQLQFGADGSQNFIVVKIGNGIGASIICNGQIFRGATEYAGSIGHINIGHDKLCYCGNRGCLEAYAGGRAIAARAELLARSNQSEKLKKRLEEKGKLKLSDVREAVVQSDPVAVELMRECGSVIGNVLSGLVNFFNPSDVIVGGSVSSVGDVLLASIRQSVYQHSLPLVTRNLNIRQLMHGDDAGLIGAAALVADEIIDHRLFDDDAFKAGY